MGAWTFTELQAAMQGWQLFTGQFVGRVPILSPPPIIRLLETCWDEHLNIFLNSTKLVMAYLYSELDGINFLLQNNKYSATCISSEKKEEKVVSSSQRVRLWINGFISTAWTLIQKGLEKGELLQLHTEKLKGFQHNIYFAFGCLTYWNLYLNINSADNPQTNPQCDI